MLLRAASITLFLALASVAAAQTVPKAVVNERGADAMKTLKEKLSDKPSDEQRVDNCGVPPDRRGPTPRPDCPAGRAPESQAAGNAH